MVVCRYRGLRRPGFDVGSLDRIDAYVETGQMSAVGTGQVSAAETGQMSAAETRQMSTIATGRCPVLILYICLVSAADICPVSAADICPVSTADISISIHHSASTFSINNQHIMETATAADFWLP